MIEQPNVNWGSIFSEVVGSAIPFGAPVALFDFPFYLNPGDSAITLGELAWLAKNGSELESVTRRESVERGCWPHLSDGVIVLFNGGGNIGDLYPEHGVLLQQVLLRFPNHEVVLFPQSLNFRRPSEAKHLSEAVSCHMARVTMMWRDSTSLETARVLFPGACHVLSPDAASGFLGWQRSGPPETAVKFLMRSDGESAMPGPSDLVSADWPYSRMDKLAWKSMRGVHRVLDLAPSLPKEWSRYLRRQILDLNLRNAVCHLSTAEVVVTDRLHGHILSTLMGIPNVLLADSYGKLRRYYEAWSRGIPFVSFADSASEIPRLVERVAESEERGSFG